MIDITSQLAFFLLDKTGDVSGTWEGKLSAAEQRTLLGAYCLGKKHIRILGQGETIQLTVKCDFGRDWDTQTVTWQELEDSLNK